MGDVTMRTNRNPRRWIDESGRVRVIEGWHPSNPDRTGYNALVDDDWLGTFSTLDDAAEAAAASVPFRRRHLRDNNVILQPYLDGSTSGP
jgi:hypothetical protein